MSSYSLESDKHIKKLKEFIANRPAPLKRLQKVL